MAAPIIPFKATVALAKASSGWVCFCKEFLEVVSSTPGQEANFRLGKEHVLCCYTCTRRNPSWNHPSLRVDHPIGAVQRNRHIIPVVEDSQAAIFTSFKLQLFAINRYMEQKADPRGHGSGCSRHRTMYFPHLKKFLWLDECRWTVVVQSICQHSSRSCLVELLSVAANPQLWKLSKITLMMSPFLFLVAS